MSSSSSESEYTDVPSDSDVSDSELNKKIHGLLRSKPEYVSNKYNKMSKQLRDRLNNCKNPDASPSGKATRKSGRLEDRSSLMDTYKQIKNNMANINKRLDEFWEILNDTLDRMDAVEERLSNVEKFEERLIKVEKLEDRILKIEEKSKNQPEDGQSYAGAVKSQPENSNRIEKLEFLNSEEERKKRILHASITHPTLNKNHDDLHAHVKSFFESTLQMDSRHIDSNFQARKGHNENNVIVSFSNKRFKIFMYDAKKLLRQSNSPAYQNLFINDDLTPYNFRILMDLKNYRKSIRRANDPFRSIYTRDGRVFVKMTTDNATAIGTAVKNPTFLHELKNGSAGQSSGTSPGSIVPVQPTTS